MSGNSKMKIYLYLAIPSAVSNKQINRTGKKYIKNRLRRLVDLAEWTLMRRTRVHYNTFEDHRHSNRGDIALQQAINSDLRRLFSNRPMEIQEIAWGDLDEGLLDEINENGDLFVIGGSGYLHINHAGDLNRIFANDLPLLGAMKCPAATLGIGINYVLMSDDALSRFSYSESAVKSFAEFASALDLISVRDRWAEAALAGPGTPYLVADPALFLPDKPVITGKKTRQNEKIRIGLNFSLHGSDSQETLHRNLPLYVKALKRIQRAHNVEYIYFLHSDAERFIWQALKIAGITAKLIDASPEEMLRQYGALDLHICQMMHSSIMSMSVCTPTLNLAYDLKILSFFDLMELSDWSVNAYTITEESLVTSIETLIKERGNIHDHLVEKIYTLHEAYEDFLREVQAIALPSPEGRAKG